MEYGMDMEPETEMVSSLGIRKINTTIYIYIYIVNNLILVLDIAFD